MKVKEVIVIGAGISGCATALALVKRGIPVTILTSSLDERLYHASFIQQEELEEKIKKLQQDAKEQVSCLRATEQLVTYASKSVNELLEPHCSIDRKGNIDIHRSLKEQLQQFPQVEWIDNHSLLELITLHQHSLRRADIYKAPMCVGVTLFNHAKGQIEQVLAKEIIIATGGAASLFPYSTQPKMSRGEGLAVAWRAGVRLLKMGHTHFYPLGLFTKGKPCLLLPLQLLNEGGQLSLTNHSPSEITLTSGSLTEQLYEQMIQNHLENLWLNLTSLDAAYLKDKFPAVDAHCLDQGLNIAKDPLPIVPVARYTCGGIAVDKVGQTNLQRLRAVGEAACTGLLDDFQDEAIGVLESLSWAVACADDIFKKISKFIYYFPELKESPIRIESYNEPLIEDWHFLRFVMWNYVGIKRDENRLKRGIAFLKQLQYFNPINFSSPLSIDRVHLAFAIQTALLIAEDASNQSQFYTETGIDVLQPVEACLMN